MSKQQRIILLSFLLLFCLVFSYRLARQISSGRESAGHTSDSSLSEGDSPGYYENLWLSSFDPDTLTVTAQTENGSVMLAVTSPLTIPEGGILADVWMTEDVATRILLKPDIVSARVLSIQDTSMELEQYGQVSLGEYVRVLDLRSSEASYLPLSSVPLGASLDFVVADQKLEAVLIRQDWNTDTIRVLLKTTDFKSLLHSSVKLVCHSETTMIYGKKEKTYPEGKTLTFQPDSKYLKEGRLQLIPKDKDAGFTLLSFTRNGSNPTYPGTLEIGKQEDGLSLVNEVTMEDYLCLVVPSEMPSSFPLEALKAQAVCARSYAYLHRKESSLKQYGAHVDDSVSYQVYNNQESSAAASQAVRETAGECLTNGGTVVSAYFYSTSCGHSAPSEEVWFGSSVPYLKSTLLSSSDEAVEASASGKTPDLSKEDVFREFIQQEDKKSFDYAYPWYRWEVELKKDSLEEVIDERIKARYQANPSMILPSGSSSPSPLGKIKELKLEERGSSGILIGLTIVGSKSSVTVRGEYNIRYVLAPAGSPILRQDDSKISTLSMLPSAFFYWEETDQGFLLYGGGYGHGVGMSQNGAGALAEQGRSYTEILSLFYPGTEVALTQAE